MSGRVASTSDLVDSLIDNAGNSGSQETENPPAESGQTSQDGSQPKEDQGPGSGAVSDGTDQSAERVAGQTAVPTDAPVDTAAPDAKSKGESVKSGSSAVLNVALVVGALLLVVSLLYIYRVWKRKRTLSEMGEELNTSKMAISQNPQHQRKRNIAANESRRSSSEMHLEEQNVGRLSVFSCAARSDTSMFKTRGVISPGTSGNKFSYQYRVSGAGVSMTYKMMTTSPSQSELNSIPKPAPAFSKAATQLRPSVSSMDESGAQLHLLQAYKDPRALSSLYDSTCGDLFTRRDGLGKDEPTMFQMPIVNELDSLRDMDPLVGEPVELSSADSHQFNASPSPVSAFPMTTLDDIEATISILPDKYRDTMKQAQYSGNQTSNNVPDFTSEGRRTAVSRISDYIIDDRRSTAASFTTEFTVDERNTAVSTVSDISLEEGGNTSGYVVIHGDLENPDQHGRPKEIEI